MKCRQKEKLIVSIVTKVLDSHFNATENMLTRPELKVKINHRSLVLRTIFEAKKELKLEGKMAHG